MDKEYFEKMENENWRRLCDFNEHTNVFTEIGRTRKFFHSDATGKTVNRLGEERLFNIELKIRNVRLLPDGTFKGEKFNKNTLMIESHKIADLLLDVIDGYEGLYINFLEDNVTVIYNVGRLTVRPELERKRIPSTGYQAFEMGNREGLYIVDAAIYKDYKLIKKIGEEWKN